MPKNPSIVVPPNCVPSNVNAIASDEEANTDQSVDELSAAGVPDPSWTIPPVTPERPVNPITPVLLEPAPSQSTVYAKIVLAPAAKDWLKLMVTA